MANARVQEQAGQLPEEQDVAAAHLVAEVEEAPGFVLPDDAREVTARMAATVQQMTYGRRILERQVLNDEGFVIKPAVLGDFNYLDFEEGRLYKMSRDLYAHLASCGLISEVVGAS
ncbi:MAG: hypothetical protein ACLQDY_25005 [Streptosporangiaceae bacterium]